MSPDTNSKSKKRRQSQDKLNRTLEELLERLRKGLDNLADGLRSPGPQPVPIPIPARRSRRR